MKKFKLFAAAFLASSLVLSGCNLLTPKKGGKGSSSGTPTDTSGSGSQSGDTVAVTGVSLNKSSLSLKVNASETLTATVNPSNATNKDVTWESSNTAIATVSNGTVKGVAKGSATITVKTSDGNFTATCSVTVSENTPAVTDWTDAQKNLMKEHLHNMVLPYVSGTFTWTWYDANGYLVGSSNDATTTAACAVYDAATGWSHTRDDYYGDPIYDFILSDKSGTIAVNIYDGSDYDLGKCVIVASADQLTTDTAWSSDVASAITSVIGESIPFYKFGSSYTTYQEEGNDFYINVYDNYMIDVTAGYVSLLKSSTYSSIWVYEGASQGKESFVKTNAGVSKIHLDVYFDEYGNNIDLTYEPVEQEANSWSDVPVSEYVTYSGINVPQFGSAPYSYFTKGTALYISCDATEDLSSSYAEALSALGLIVDTESNYALDWNEKICFSYGPDGVTDDDGELTSITSFIVVVDKLTSDKEFSNSWPTSVIQEFVLDQDEEFPADSIPELDNTTGKDIRYYEWDFETALNYIYNLYGDLISLYFETEEEIEEAAMAYVGLYVEAYDPEDTLTATYNALFDTAAWTKEENKDSEDNVASYSWTENESQLYLEVYNSGTAFVLFIPSQAGGGDTPVDPTGSGEVSVTMSEYAAANSWTNASQYLSFDLDDVISVECSEGTNNGKYYESGGEWRIYQSEGGTFTISAASGHTIETVTVTYNVKNGGVMLNGTTQVPSGTTVNVNASSITFSADSTTGTSGQVKVTGITVTYN